MEGDIILQFVEGLHPVIKEIFFWVSFISTILVGLIAVSPWKGDDEALEQVKKMPLVGSIVAALLKRSPFDLIKKK